MTLQNVSVEKDPPIATITLNSSSPPNAIDEQLAYAIRDVCEQVSQDDEIWVAIIAAQGNALCSGTDFSGVVEDGIGDVFQSLRIAGCIASIDKPVIAGLNGDAIDQGLEIALACDIRVASSDASFGLTQVKNGMMPWDGGTQRLPRLIGRSRAMEMILTSRVVTSQEALEIGLVNEVASPESVPTRANEIASMIAHHGPIAARYLKEAVLNGADMTLEQGLRLEADLNFILQSTSDRAEGLDSFLKRRTPEYRGG